LREGAVLRGPGWTGQARERTNSVSANSIAALVLTHAVGAGHWSSGADARVGGAAEQGPRRRRRRCARKLSGAAPIPLGCVPQASRVVMPVSYPWLVGLTGWDPAGVRCSSRCSNQGRGRTTAPRRTLRARRQPSFGQVSLQVRAAPPPVVRHGPPVGPRCCELCALSRDHVLLQHPRQDRVCRQRRVCPGPLDSHKGIGECSRRCAHASCSGVLQVRALVQRDNGGVRG